MTLKSPTLVTWNSLKKLSLNRTTVSEDAIQRILAGTPVLETLELIFVKGIKSLQLGTSSVKELTVHYRGSDLELSAPNLRSLTISGYFSGHIKLADLSSLVKVSLGRAYVDEESVNPLDFARRLLNSFLHVETLTLGTREIEGVAKLCPNAGLPRWKNLTIDTHLWVTNPQAIATLLNSCPELETLIINMSMTLCKYKCSIASRSELHRVQEFWGSHNSVFNGLKLLRTVEFVGFLECRAITFSIAKFLLEKANALCKLIVDIKTNGHVASDVQEATQRLLSMAKSSSDAEIVVY